MISVTCGVRDRAAHLDVSLRSWLACEEVGEVLVVDWTSREPVTPPHDERAVLVRVEGQARWHSSKCHNLELLLARGEEILRLDADHVLRPGFFARHPAPEKGYFYRYAITPQSPENEKHLAGAVYARREHFMRVGGYNEHLSTYGYEDEDLVRRLISSGLEAQPLAPRDLDPSYMHHLPHGDDARLAAQDVPADICERPPWAPWSWQPGRVVDDLSNRNRHLVLAHP